ncbi:hypothetical protein PQ462_08155 [Flavobacterium sp. KACC 22758]|uniref:hypothetical protein n=1 Tax=Flavobacterium sp. KACC 22758 TaxID=3025667 RepID=UPI0023672092|nr:hypothetical protein [Flavobacterium sp. KACC 22758]WDF61336.1 hypothetical protein PQ462_08155 [Flavobacterium sp. KACC 22758]
MKNIILVVVFMIVSCNNKENKKERSDNNIKKENNQNMELNITEIEKHIELQKRIESDEIEYEHPYSFAEKDLKLAFQLIEEGLKKQNYKIPTLEKFNQVINIKSNYEWYYSVHFNGDCLEWKYDNLLFSHFDLIDRGHYVFTNKRFITDLFLLEEIVKINKDHSYTLQIPEYIVARNKYLFNDNKASLVWLKFNDEYFLESLVKVFGYVQDEDLLKWVLDRNLNDDEFDKLLLTKTCDNKYIFHKEVFEVMTKADKKSKESYLLYLRGKTELPKVDDTNFSDTAKIYALYCYYATKFTQSIDQGDVYTFFPKLNEKKYEEEFRKNNYYNIPDFKELFEDTKNGGIGLPM